jgi:N-glycosylase/DNA lyase
MDPHALRSLHKQIKKDVDRRLEEFRRMWREAGEEDLFAELAFCLLTPQSKAVRCWDAICRLKEDGTLYCGDAPRIRKVLARKTRFHNKKSLFLAEARQFFTASGRLAVRDRLLPLGGPERMREWLKENIKGYGWKEASHFLRNIGLGEDLAILDRHVLRNLVLLGVIKREPAGLTSKTYLRLEKKMREFSRQARIPMSHLDFVLFYKETGVIFK